jgi:hypothetical protein
VSREIYGGCFRGEEFGGSVFLAEIFTVRKSQTVRLVSARAGLMRRASAEPPVFRASWFACFYYGFHVIAA